MNRLSRRISQSGANLKRKVSKGGKVPVRRASEADKENRVKAAGAPIAKEEGEREVGSGKEEEKRGDGGGETAQTSVAKPAALKRGLRVSVMRRTKSEGAKATMIERQEEKMEELIVPAEVPVTENQSEVSSNRGSYFYSNSLGVCWDGRERGEFKSLTQISRSCADFVYSRAVHPDAFAFREYSSNADVVPAPVVTVTSDRVVYASTLSSFPPRPPLRPRTPPQLTPASLIVAEYRALHGTITPSIYSFSDFDTPPVDVEHEITPTNGSPLPDSPPSHDLSFDSNTTPTRAQLYAQSISEHSSSSSSLGEPLTPGLSEDSSTSLESLARDGHQDQEEEEEDTTRVQLFVPKSVTRFTLTDSGPVPLPLNAKPSMVFSEASSTVDSWRDCEE